MNKQNEWGRDDKGAEYVSRKVINERRYDKSRKNKQKDDLKSIMKEGEGIEK